MQLWQDLAKGIPSGSIFNLIFIWKYNCCLVYKCTLVYWILLWWHPSTSTSTKPRRFLIPFLTRWSSELPMDLPCLLVSTAIDPLHCRAFSAVNLLLRRRPAGLLLPTTHLGEKIDWIRTTLRGRYVYHYHVNYPWRALVASLRLWIYFSLELMHSVS